jgi:hypothetical protein
MAADEALRAQLRYEADFLAAHNPHTLTALVLVADSDTPVTAEQLAQRFGPRKQ